MDSNYFGGNGDSYSGSGKIWEIADRYNKESKKLNGQVTSRTKKFVKQCERVGIL